MDFERIRRRLEEELFTRVENEIHSEERELYEARLAEWEARYRASRSVKGMRDTGSADPEAAPLEDPWPGCADLGTPIELSLTQELVPNVMSASLGMRPYTETTIIGPQGQMPAGQVDDFLTYMMDRCNIRSVRRKTVLAAYKFGEGIEKLIIEPLTRTCTETRTYLVNGKGKAQKILIAPDGKPLELQSDEEDLKGIMLQQMTGQDPRSQYFRYCMRQLGLDEHSALEAAGVETGEDWIRVAPLEQVNGPEQPPAANWDKATRYEKRDVEVSEEVMVNQWPQIVHVHPKNFIVPSDAETNNIMDYWNCHRYRQPMEWLIERVGDGHGDGFYKDAVDQIIDKYKELKKKEGEKREEAQPEIYEVYDRFVLNDSDEGEDNYLRETEIVAWFCPEGGESKLLGWMTNPASRFKSEHIRPFFVFQVKPENHGFHGLSIPETATGTRDMLDWLANNELNYESISKFPPVLQTANAFANEQNQHFGPGERWVVEAGESISLLQYMRPAGGSLGLYNMLLTSLRIMWGASEHMSGQKTETDSKTLGEAQLIAAKGAMMFQDTVESISQQADLQYEYMKNFYLYSDIRDLMFPLPQGKDQPDAQAIASVRQMLAAPMVIKSRRVLTETERAVKMKEYQLALEFLAKVQSPLLTHPGFMHDVMTRFFDALNLESIKIPSPEEIMQMQATVQRLAQEQVVKERYAKAAEGIANKGARKQVEEFLNRAGPGAQPGMAAVGGPGQMQMPTAGVGM